MITSHHGGVDPAFLAIMRFPLKKARRVFFFFFFLCVCVGKPFLKKTVWSRHLFLFYFKGEKQNKKEKP